MDFNSHSQRQTTIQNFTEITIEDVKAHAKIYQDRSTREVQNSEMLIQSLKASITRSVYNKVCLQREKYIILRENTFEQVEDGICFLKTIIDNYHSNTRSSTKQIRKQLATLNHYMRAVAKGDVSKLCEHTREPMYELNAAGETTTDLLANLIEALKEAPDSNFQRWLSNQVDLWSMRKLDWKQDGSGLMEEAEIYYKEAMNTHRWRKKAYRPDVQYAFKSTTSDDEWTKIEKEKPESRTHEDEIRALTAKLNEYTTAFNSRWSVLNDDSMDKKYAWKKTPPKNGEPSTKKVHVNGVSKTYYWCPYHQQWTVDYQVKTPSMREHDLTWRPYGYYKKRKAMAVCRKCIALKSIQIIEAKSAVDKERRLKMEFDTDSFDILIDNCCSHTLTNDINDYIEPQVKSSVRVRGYNGSTNLTMVGTVKWKIKDDKGKVHNFILPNTYYSSSVETRLLSPQHWAQTRKKGRDSYCITYHDAMIMRWNKDKYRITAPLDNRKHRNVGVVRSAPGIKQYITSCQAIDQEFITIAYPATICMDCQAAEVTDDEASVEAPKVSQEKSEKTIDGARPVTPTEVEQMR